MGDLNDESDLARSRAAQPTSTPEQRRRRDALARNLCARLCDDRRSLDELRVLDVIFGRLELGADRYGPLDLENDARDFRVEAAEEIVDKTIYDACDLLKRRDERLDRIACEVADEIAHLNPVETGLRELAAFDVSDIEDSNR